MPQDPETCEHDLTEPCDECGEPYYCLNCDSCVECGAGLED